MSELTKEIMKKHRLMLKHIVENDGIKSRNYHCNKIIEDRSEEDLPLYEKGKNRLYVSPKRRKR